jgi:uncharacterized protein
MPGGKPAFVRCVQLDAANRCLLFGKPERPEVCRSLRPQLEMCGASNDEAFVRLHDMEFRSRPDSQPSLGDN